VDEVRDSIEILISLALRSLGDMGIPLGQNVQSLSLSYLICIAESVLDLAGYRKGNIGWDRHRHRSTHANLV